MSPVVDPQDVLTRTEYENYRAVRSAALRFLLFGAFLIIVAIVAIAENKPGGRKNLSAEGGLIAFAFGVVGLGGGAAVRFEKPELSWFVWLMGMMYVWVFPIGTLPSLVILGGRKKYFASVSRLHRTISGEVEHEPDEWEEARAKKSYLICSRCESPNIVLRPASQISPHPGYHCLECGALLRSRGMFVVYLMVLALGCVFVGLFIYLLAIGSTGPERFVTPLAGAICAVYSIRQLLRPAPRRVQRHTNE